MSGGPEHTADALRRAVTRLAGQLRRLRAGHGISAAKLSLLGQLYRAGAGVTAVELARADKLQPQSLTRIIAELDARGLVERRQNPQDRRELLLHITSQGRDLLRLDAQRQNAWLAAALAEVSSAEERQALAAAAALLERIADMPVADD